MTRLLISAFLLGLPFVAKADIVTNVTCSAYGYSASFDPANCVQGGGLAYGPSVEAHASVSTTFNMPSVPSGYLIAGIDESVSEVPLVGSQMVGPSSASSSASIDANLFTNGPVRQGFVQLYLPTLSRIDSPEGYSGEMDLSLGSVTGSCQPGGSPTCRVDTYYVTTSNTLLLPFTLGESFTFQFSQTDSVYGDLDSGDSEGVDQTAVAFRLLEADGSTPVPLYDSGSSAPEPASFGILALGIVALGLTVRRRRANSRLVAGSAVGSSERVR